MLQIIENRNLTFISKIKNLNKANSNSQKYYVLIIILNEIKFLFALQHK